VTGAERVALRPIAQVVVEQAIRQAPPVVLLARLHEKVREKTPVAVLADDRLSVDGFDDRVADGPS
jgi:hypothetical protein